MLSPDTRQVATEILRAPPGYSLERTLLTTYSLDLEVLLALPLAVLGQSDRGVEELLDNPPLLLEALREASDRVHVFVDEAGIAIPRVNRELYAMLESSVHPVRAPGGGAFHAKVWIARFTSESEPPLLRVGVASRNLTFDRSWDVALVSEAHPSQDAQQPASQPLADLVSSFSQLSREPLDIKLQQALQTVSLELAHTRFPSPDGFEGWVRFHCLGVKNEHTNFWNPTTNARRFLGIAPFVGKKALDTFSSSGAEDLILVSRTEALNALPSEALEGWTDVRVLMESALEEFEDDTASRSPGLHAKLMAVERDHRVNWFLGSANLTTAALDGSNLEVMAEIGASVGKQSSGSGTGIDSFLEAGFSRLCMPYQPRDSEEEPQEVLEARKALEKARDFILDSGLAINCVQTEHNWRVELIGRLPEVPGVAFEIWPVTLTSHQARTQEDEMEWHLPLERLTAFVAFRLKSNTDVEDLTLVVKLPAQGMPEWRMNRILRTVINTPERFLKFLQALLGGLEGLVNWWESGQETSEYQSQGVPLETEAVLEDLLRAASRDPERLETVRRLFKDLEGDSNESSVVPRDLYRIWQAIEQATEIARKRTDA